MKKSNHIYTANATKYHGLVVDYQEQKNVQIPIYPHAKKYLIKWRHTYDTSPPKIDRLKDVYLKQFGTGAIDDWKKLIQENVFEDKSDHSNQTAKLISIHLLSTLFNLKSYPYKANTTHIRYVLSNWRKYIPGNRGKDNNNTNNKNYSSSSSDGDSEEKEEKKSDNDIWTFEETHQLKLYDQSKETEEFEDQITLDPVDIYNHKRTQICFADERGMYDKSYDKYIISANIDRKKVFWQSEQIKQFSRLLFRISFSGENKKEIQKEIQAIIQSHNAEYHIEMVLNIHSSTMIVFGKPRGGSAKFCKYSGVLTATKFTIRNIDKEIEFSKKYKKGDYKSKFEVEYILDSQKSFRYTKLNCISSVMGCGTLNSVRISLAKMGALSASAKLVAIKYSLMIGFVILVQCNFSAMDDKAHTDIKLRNVFFANTSRLQSINVKINQRKNIEIKLHLIYPMIGDWGDYKSDELKSKTLTKSAHGTEGWLPPTDKNTASNLIPFAASKVMCVLVIEPTNELDNHLLTRVIDNCFTDKYQIQTKRVKYIKDALGHIFGVYTDEMSQYLSRVWTKNNRPRLMDSITDDIFYNDNIGCVAKQVMVNYYDIDENNAKKYEKDTILYPILHKLGWI